MLQATDPPEELARGARRMRSEPIMMPTLAKAPTHDVGVPVGGAALEIPEKGCRFLRFASCEHRTVPLSVLTESTIFFTLVVFFLSL